MCGWRRSDVMDDPLQGDICPQEDIAFMRIVMDLMWRAFEEEIRLREKFPAQKNLTELHP